MALCDGNNDFATVFEKDFCPIRTSVINILASGFVSTFNTVTGDITVAGTSGIHVAAQGGGSFLVGYPSGVGVRSLQSLQGDLTLTGISGIVIDTIGADVIRISQASGVGGGGGGNPVDSRAVTGSIMPDTNIVYDIGVSSLRYATIAAESGYFQRLQSIDQNLELYTSPGKIIDISGSMIPVTDQEFDIGLGDLRWSVVYANIGNFNEITSPSETSDLIIKPHDVLRILANSGLNTATEIHISGLTETEQAIVPEVDGSGVFGIPTQQWRQIVGRTGIFSFNILPDTAGGASCGSLTLPWNNTFTNNLVVNTAVGSHLNPGVDNTNDLGTLSQRWRTLNATSGNFNNLAINGSGIPGQFVGISGIIINNDGIGNITISQNAPVDVRNVRGHINPDEDSVYDIGLAPIFGSPDPPFRFRCIHGISGIFNSLASNDTTLFIGTKNDITQIEVQSLTAPKFAMSPLSDTDGDLGTASQRWGNIHGVSGFWDRLEIAGTSVVTSVTGTSGIIASANDTGAVVVSQHRSRIAQLSSDAQDINASASNNLVNWDISDIVDTEYYTHSTSTNPSRVTVLHNGRYEVNVILSYNTNIANENAVRYNGKVKLRVNGSTVKPYRGKSGYVRGATGHNESSLHLYMVLSLNANDYVEILVDRESSAVGEANLNSNQSILTIKSL